VDVVVQEAGGEDEDLDGAPIEDLDGSPMEDSETRPTVTEDIDGAAIEDLDGVPVSDDLDGVPCEYHANGSQASTLRFCIHWPREPVDLKS